jgi:hypothetical protein
MAIIETDKQDDVMLMRNMISNGRTFNSNAAIAVVTDTRAQVENESRYTNHRIVQLTMYGRIYRTLETWERPVIPAPFTEEQKFFNVTRAFAARPDKIAVRALGSKFLWWWVMFLNGIDEVEDIEAGMTLRINRSPQDNPLRNISFRGVS